MIERSKGTHNLRIHSFGIGDGCDKQLVEKVAENGRGSCSLITDDKSHLVGARIIKALEKAFEPSFQNCKLVISHGTTENTYNLGDTSVPSIKSRAKGPQCKDNFLVRLQNTRFKCLISL